jgi:hypothetical protein
LVTLNDLVGKAAAPIFVGHGFGADYELEDPGWNPGAHEFDQHVVLVV